MDITMTQEKAPQGDVQYVILRSFLLVCAVRHCEERSDVAIFRSYGYKKNETRHSREAPHTNHIINNTKTNNRVQRYGHSVNPQ